jgi:hypothetical protein
LIVSLKTSSKALETPLSWRSTRPVDERGKETALVTSTVMDGVSVGAEVGFRVGALEGLLVGFRAGALEGLLVGGFRSPWMHPSLI